MYFVENHMIVKHQCCSVRGNYGVPFGSKRNSSVTLELFLVSH